MKYKLYLKKQVGDKYTLHLEITDPKDLYKNKRGFHFHNKTIIPAIYSDAIIPGHYEGEKTLKLSTRFKWRKDQILMLAIKVKTAMRALK